jgi:S-adenosylmethionine synthetase
MMFGYATRESANFMPLPIALAHTILQELAQLRLENNEVKYLRPDAKSQVTIEYSDDHKPVRIDAIVVSTQHDDFIKPCDGSLKAVKKADDEMADQIKHDIIHILIPRVIEKQPPDIQGLFNKKIKYYINPTGKFVIGGPHGDTGLTGRKIIVDTYGGKGAHGGGAFSGKDPSKVDRSGAYAARHIAKNMVAAGVADQMMVQISYAIGISEPTGIFVDTFGSKHVKESDGEIAQKIKSIFDLRPGMIEKSLKLRNPIYLETAAYGHMGRRNEVVKKKFVRPVDGQFEVKEIEVELFTWEKLDYVERIKKAFTLK